MFQEVWQRDGGAGGSDTAYLARVASTKAEKLST
jgi:hypothetical protein